MLRFAAGTVTKVAHARVVAVTLVDVVQFLVPGVDVTDLRRNGQQCVRGDASYVLLHIPFIKNEAVGIQVAGRVPSQTHMNYGHRGVQEVGVVFLQVKLLLFGRREW